MLSDSQIDRYSRQIVLAEIGGRGQERLLRSAVTVRGGADAALVCASYLAGAGVGVVALEDVSSGAMASILALETRNPDCRIVEHAVVACDLLVAIGSPGKFHVPATPVVWGGGTPDTLSSAYFPSEEACASCLADVARREDRGGASPQILGALLAVEALRVLLGLAAKDRPTLRSLDLRRAAATSLPFPFRSDCRCRKSS